MEPTKGTKQPAIYKGHMCFLFSGSMLDGELLSICTLSPGPRYVNAKSLDLNIDFRVSYKGRHALGNNELPKC